MPKWSIFTIVYFLWIFDTAEQYLEFKLDFYIFFFHKFEKGVTIFYIIWIVCFLWKNCWHGIFVNTLTLIFNSCILDCELIWFKTFLKWIRSLLEILLSFSLETKKGSQNSKKNFSLHFEGWTDLVQNVYEMNKIIFNMI